MDTLTTYDPVMEALHLREQLSSPSRRLGFFFDAGTSIAVGLNGITTITKKVAEMISEELKPCYQNLLDETGINGNVEDVLNRVRVYRELLGDDALQSFSGISGASKGLPALVNIDNMVLRHCAIVGSTGSGKSNSVAQILKALTTGYYPGIRVILIDPHGEYFSALKDVSRVFRIDDPENPLYLPFWTLTFDELAWFLVDRKTGTETVQDGNLRGKIFEQKRAMAEKLKAGCPDESAITVDSPIPFCIRETWYHFDRAERVTYEDVARTKEALVEEGDAQSLKSAQFKPPGAGSSLPFKPSGGTGQMLHPVC